MARPVVHFEIGCDNLPETAKFYKDVFNWDYVPAGNSAAINTGNSDGIPGHFTALGHEPRKYINIYIETDNMGKDLKLIESKGGKTLVGPIALHDGRSFAWFQDVAGNTIGLITPTKES